MARIIDNKKDLLNLCFRNLTPIQLLYVRLYYVEGMSMRQIAKECGVNPSTVSRGIKRGLTALKEKAFIIQAISEVDLNE